MLTVMSMSLFFLDMPTEWQKYSTFITAATSCGSGSTSSQYHPKIGLFDKKPCQQPKKLATTDINISHEIGFLDIYMNAISTLGKKPEGI